MDYSNPAECIDMLQRLHPVDADETHYTLSCIVDGLMQGSAAANQQFEVLEALRAPLEQVQEEFAKRYAAHPLPPESEENRILGRVVDLWQRVARAYSMITRKDAAEGTLDDQRALLSQRRVSYAGLALFEYFRAHRMVPKNLWTELHESYSMAEAQGVARTRVSDPLNTVWRAQSALEAYIAALLVDLSNPFGRSQREFAWVCRWAQRFAPYCTLEDVSLAPDSVKPTTYGLDLNEDHGLRPIGLLPVRKTLRYFDGTRLAAQIQAVLEQFKQGTRPQALGLGDDCPVDLGARLLLSLYRPWGLASVGRRFPRRHGQGEAELSGDWLAIGFHVQGRLFEQPAAIGTPRSLRSDITLLTFGERAAGIEQEPTALDRQRAAERHGFVCEKWEVLDQSIGGFRLRQQPPAVQLEHRQLAGVRAPDGAHFLIALVSWLMYQEDGTLEAGITLLPGVPRVVAIRRVGANASQRGAYQQAFWLSETPALKKEATLVLPGGWFQPQRTIEVYDGKSRQLRMMKLLARGANFDHVSYEAVNGDA